MGMEAVLRGSLIGQNTLAEFPRNRSWVGDRGMEGWVLAARKSDSDHAETRVSSRQENRGCIPDARCQRVYALSGLVLIRGRMGEPHHAESLRGAGMQIWGWRQSCEVV